MALTGLFAIACFVSPNPLPLTWIVSGPPAAVERLTVFVAGALGHRVVARAEGAGVAFARYEAGPDVKYGDFMATMNLAQGSDLVSSMPAPIVPDCKDGMIDEVGNPHVDPVLGLVGEPVALSRLQRQIPWTSFEPVELEDGRAAVAARPGDEDSEHYRAFVARAAAGEFNEVSVVILKARQRRPAY